MDAQEIVQAIGEGVAEALRTNRDFLGAEGDAYTNADIHPEYVTTVEVAKKLTGPDRVVSLETHMKVLRRHARGMAVGRSWKTKTDRGWIDAALSNYRFGKKDSQRIDILVRSSDDQAPPLLIAEAKLGVKKLPGILQDIDRVVQLLAMYEDLHLLDGHHIYGAVLFHYMEEGNGTGAPSLIVQNHLAGIQAHVESISLTKRWVRARVGLLTHGATTQPVTGYREINHDGSVEDVFAKESFTFAPGLVLLGNALDVTSVRF